MNITDYLAKAGVKLRTFVNSIRIPRLLSFFITKEGEVANNLEDALQEAKDPSSNWQRLGLDKKVFGNIKVWMIIALPIVMIAVRYGSEALQFFIEIISQGIMLIPLLVIGYVIYKSVKK